MATKKKNDNVDIPKALYQGIVERFTAVVMDAKSYPLLSVHDFDDVKYRVDSIMKHRDGVAVEFVRVA